MDAESTPVRSRVNDIYERVVNAIFGSIQQIAKLDRGDALATEDKGQINYHVVMIGESLVGTPGCPRVDVGSGWLICQRICTNSWTI